VSEHTLFPLGAAILTATALYRRLLPDGIGLSENGGALGEPATPPRGGDSEDIPGPGTILRRFGDNWNTPIRKIALKGSRGPPRASCYSSRAVRDWLLVVLLLIIGILVGSVSKYCRR